MNDTPATPFDSALLSDLERALIDRYQHGLPMTLTPYADMAAALGVSESEVLAALGSLRDKQVLSRVGFVFAPNTIGASTLAAVAVPEQRLEEVAAIINAYPEVNHNYQREHHFNLWFVATTDGEQHLHGLLRNIESVIGLPVMSLPMEQDYFIDLGFALDWNTQAGQECGGHA